MSMPPISSTICWKFGKLARITKVMGTPTTADTASASARNPFSPPLTTYEFILLPVGPSVSRGMSSRVAACSAGLIPTTWMASARPGSSGDWLGSSDRAPVPSTSTKNGCCGPRGGAPPSLVTSIHTAPAAGVGLPTASHAVVMPPARSRSAEHRADHERGDERADACDGEGRARPRFERAGALRWAGFVPFLVDRRCAVVVVGSSPAPARVTTMLYEVTFHAPDGSGASTKSTRRTMCSGAPFTWVSPRTSTTNEAVSSVRLPWSPSPRWSPVWPPRSGCR